MLQFSQYGTDGAHVELLFQATQMGGQTAWSVPELFQLFQAALDVGDVVEPGCVSEAGEQVARQAKTAPVGRLLGFCFLSFGVFEFGLEAAAPARRISVMFECPFLREWLE